MPDTLLSPTACNFIAPSAFNANYDIVWSFQYSLCGNTNTSGGFTTFLVDSTVPQLTGGGIGRSLGYGPSTNFTNTTNISGISGAVLGIAFDSTGLFATSGYGFSNGVLNPSANSISFRTGYNHLSTFVLSALSTNVLILTSAETYNTLRFQLTNIGRTINVDYLDTKMNYNRLVSVDTNIVVSTNTSYKIGISYASPVSGSVNKSVLNIKNLHVHGTQNVPTTTELSFTPL